MPTTFGGLALGNGVNLQPSYYNNGNVNFGWDLMQQQSKIKTVRIEIEPAATEQATGWIAEAQSKGYHVVATYHNQNIIGSNNPDDLIAAATWWKDNYAG